MSRTYAYRVTWSEVETVPVGTFLIDYEDKGEGWDDVRTWGLFHEATAEFREGWTARRLDRLCTPCRRDHRKAALHGHEGEHGTAPMYRPPAT